MHGHNRPRDAAWIAAQHLRGGRRSDCWAVPGVLADSGEHCAMKKLKRICISYEFKTPMKHPRLIFNDADMRKKAWRRQPTEPDLARRRRKRAARARDKRRWAARYRRDKAKIEAKYIEKKLRGAK
jgi:hypothetical protein